MSRHLGTAGLSATFALWSLANVFTSIAFFGAMGVLYQSAILFLCFIIVSKARNLTLFFGESKKVLPHAIFRMIGLVLLTASLLYVKVGIVDTIVACNVFFVICILAPLGGEKFKPLMLIPLAASIFGVGLVCINSSAGEATKLDLTLLLPLGAMIALAISVFFWRKCSAEIAPTKYLAYMHGWVSLLCLPFLAFLSITNFTPVDFVPSLKQIAFISVAMVVGNIGDVLFSLSQKFSSYTQNALFAPSGAVFSSLFGWLIADQKLGNTQIAGMVIVVVSVVIASLINIKSNAKAACTPETIEDETSFDNLELQNSGLAPFTI